MADDTEAPPAGSNTAPKQRSPGKPFTKDDPRINRKGRPKSFDALRALAQQIAAAPATKPSGEKILIDGHLATNAEYALFMLAKGNPSKFLEWAYGAPPPNAPVNALGDLLGHLPKPFLDRVAKGEALDVVFRDWVLTLIQQNKTTQD